MPLRKLYKTSPLGVVSCLIAGVIYSALFNLLPVFANEFNIVGFNLSVYVGVGILSAFILQFPVGYLSDRFDRRKVLLVLLIISASAGLINIIFAQQAHLPAMFVVTGITCGLVACIYPLSIAEAFDRLRQSEMVAAMGSMILAFSVGGVLGPLIASSAMSRFGGSALFYFLAVIQFMLAIFVMVRMKARQSLPIEDQESFIMQNSAVPPSVELDPRSEYIEQVHGLSAEAETALAIAKVEPAAAIKMLMAICMVNSKLALEVAAAITKVKAVDVLRLLDLMMQSLPAHIPEIAKTLVVARPELAYELIVRLGEYHPEQVVVVVEQIGQEQPDLRVVTAKAAMEVVPESAIDMAEYYASLLAQEHEAVRPAERDEDSSGEFAVNISAELWQGSAEQSLDVAIVMADAIPESAVSLAQEYIAVNAGFNDDEALDISTAGAELADDNDETVQSDPQAEYENTIELVNRFAQAAPEQALDMAVAVVEVMPGSAAEVAAAMASNITERETLEDNDLLSSNSSDEVEITEHEDMVELVNRLTEVSPDNALDVAVAVVEQVPDSAAMVAAEYATTIYEDQADNSFDNDDAVELVNRLSNVSPDNAMDVAVAVVEVIPESASEVVDAISEGDESVDEEWMTGMDEKPK